MPLISRQCPHCGANNRVPDYLAGNAIKCTSCHTEFIVTVTQVRTDRLAIYLTILAIVCVGAATYLVATMPPATPVTTGPVAAQQPQGRPIPGNVPAHIAEHLRHSMEGAPINTPAPRPKPVVERPKPTPALARVEAKPSTVADDASETTWTLVHRFYHPKTSQAQRDEYAARLVQRGDSALPEIEDKYAQGWPHDRNHGRQMLRVLGWIDTPASLKLLKSVLVYVAVTQQDFSDISAIVAALVAHSKGGDSGAGHILHQTWTRLPKELKDELIAADEGEEAPAPDLLRKIVRALNTVIEQRDLTHNPAVRDLPFSDNARGLLARHLANKDPFALPDAHDRDTYFKKFDEGTLELDRVEINLLNRRALDLAFGGALADGPAIYSIDNYNTTGQDLAAEVLLQMRTPGAREAFLEYKPISVAGRTGHLRALASAPISETAWALGQYLRTGSASESNQAMLALHKGGTENASLVRRVIEQVRNAAINEGERAEPYVARNAILAGAGLAASDASSWIGECLRLPDRELRATALEALRERVDVLYSGEILDGLYTVIATEDAPHIAEIMQLLRNRPNPEYGIDLAAEALYLPGARIQAEAVRTLQTLTQEQIGDNPADWKRWLAENHR